MVKSALVPTSIKGQTRVVQFIILKEDVPPLLPVGLLDMLDAEVRLRKNELELKELGVVTEMLRLPDGHRSTSIADPLEAGAEFIAPSGLCEKHGLGERVFCFGCAYKERHEHAEHVGRIPNRIDEASDRGSEVDAAIDRLAVVGGGDSQRDCGCDCRVGGGGSGRGRVLEVGSDRYPEPTYSAAN